MKFAAFVDAGSLWDYQGPVSNGTEVLSCAVGVGGDRLIAASPHTACLGDSDMIRSSAGVGIIWDSPFGPLRFDYAVPITKTKYDRVQEFRFGGGAKF